MSNEENIVGRRKLFQVAAGAALAKLALGAATVGAAPKARTPGKPGDFDFLTGSWTIKNRQLKNRKTDEWDVFNGESTCWSILGGVASIEELRIPERHFSGMGLRVLDMEKKVWADYWMNSKSGVLGAAGVPGSFENGAGIFESEETEGDKTTTFRGVWDRITKNSCRWHQASSADGGKTWETSWSMDWTRAKSK